MHTRTPVSNTALLTAARVRERPKGPPTGENTYVVWYHLAVKKDEISPLAPARVGLERGTLSETRLSLQTEKQMLHHFTCTWNLRDKIREQVKLKQSLPYREQTGGGHSGWKRGRDEVQRGNYRTGPGTKVPPSGCSRYYCDDCVRCQVGAGNIRASAS